MNASELYTQYLSRIIHIYNLDITCILIYIQTYYIYKNIHFNNL